MLKSAVGRTLLATLFLGVSLWTSSASAQKLGLEDHSACDYPAGFPELPESEWRHTRSKLIAKVGDPFHFARDAVTVAKTNVKLQAKFTYGDASKDLEDETVRVLLQTCKGWKKLGEGLTDDDGWVKIDTIKPIDPGIYRLVFQQVADGTYVTSRLWVVPQGTKVAVFDIDGTLTTGDEEAWREVADDIAGDGEYVPEAYPGGKELTQFLARRGYLVLYLTGRPYLLGHPSRQWLIDQGMADGPLRLTTTNSDVWPSDSAVGQYKLEELEDLKADGLKVEVAHGNATTDITAYVGAGIPKERIWIIGKHAGSEGTRAVDKDWQTLLEALQEEQAEAKR